MFGKRNLRRHPSQARMRAALAAAALLAAWTAVAAASGPTPQDRALLLDVPDEPVAAEDFLARRIDGENYRLSDLRGKVVFMNFWATWCVPCLREMPAMERLNRRMAGKAFKMIAVNQGESVAQIEKFLLDKEFSYDLLLDADGAIGANYGVNRLPLTYILDPQGRIVRRAIGAREWDQPQVVELLEHLIRSGGAKATTRTTRARTAGGAGGVAGPAR